MTVTGGDIRNHNYFKVGKINYRWAYCWGEILLYSDSDQTPPITSVREGKLYLKRSEWVFTQGPWKAPICTGTSNVVEAKKIVQVRLAMEV